MPVDPTLIVTGEETHVGQVRSINQDACAEWTHPDGRSRLLLVADGMGGHQGGEIASQLTVDTIGEAFREGGSALQEEPERWLEQAIGTANRRVFAEGQSQPNLTRMGTTVVALLFGRRDEALVAHVGDSRAYRLREGKLEQLTGDHSVVGELVREGHLTPEQARVHPQRNEIQRAIGTHPEVDIEVQRFALEGNDTFLLCSDGLSGLVQDDEIAEVLERQAPEAAVHELVQMANLAGGNDNITVQVARVPASCFDTTASVVRPAVLERVPGVASAPGWLRWAVAGSILGLAALYWLLTDRA